MTERTFEALRRGTIRVDVRHRYPLAAAAEAHRDLEGRRTTGQIVRRAPVRSSALRGPAGARRCGTSTADGTPRHTPGRRLPVPQRSTFDRGALPSVTLLLVDQRQQRPTLAQPARFSHEGRDDPAGAARRAAGGVRGDDGPRVSPEAMAARQRLGSVTSSPAPPMRPSSSAASRSSPKTMCAARDVDRGWRAGACGGTGRARTCGAWPWSAAGR